MPSIQTKKSSNSLLGWLAIGAVLTALVFIFAGLAISPNGSGKSQTRLVVHQAKTNAFGQLKIGATDSARLEAGGSTEPSRGDLTIAPVPPDVKQFTYAFSGTLPTTDLSVLRRSNDLGGPFLGNALSAQLTDLIDLDRLKSLQFQQVTMVEEGDDGFQITLDHQSGMIMMYRVQKYETMVKSDTSIGVNASPSAVPLPPDDELIQVANKFLSEYQISRTGLTEPQVRKDWMMWLAGAPESERLSYVPADVTIVYPWKIQGTNVYDESGNQYGLSVNVNVATKKVSGVTNIAPMEFTASKYELVTDEKTIRDIVSRGGVYGSSPIDGGGEVTTVPVGQPTVVYMASRYQLDQTSTEYLIPALRFPVEQPDPNTYPQFIMVPLVADLLNAYKVIPLRDVVEPAPAADVKDN